ncbi:signal recognition particle-docking protein FtsY [Limosilactobacillus caviae]|uniref:Signal recognition particle receptor FtsY n=1 Tax=Limosilactobacillus caviae TaxID=1769424 RepID=A0ABQ2C720_9LACO|nr:signal recognition particle-docking protein FtsY [Limosilactobacillus caviae]GGI63782.1 signal recognition particle receptor FtsY [Limosilactobacillus caviae]
MGLFDIFRRHKKKEEEKSAESSSAAVQSATADEKSANAPSTAPASSAIKQPEPVNIPPADSYEEKINPDGSHEVIHNGKEEKTEEASQSSAAEEVSAEPESSTVVTEEATNDESEAAPAQDESVSEEETVEEETETSKDETLSDIDEAAKSDNDVTNTEETPEPEEETETVKKYDRGLEKSRTGFGARLNKFLANFRHVDEDFFDDLEDMLIESDVGYDMAMKLSDELREEVKLQNAKSKQDVSNVIIEKMVELYDEAGQDENPDLTMAKEGPTVIMFVGVNGAGKTTTIGKMAALFKKQGKKVLLAAADTFRAGATEQLDVWAKRDGVDIVTGPENGDPAAVVFDAVKRAKDEEYDVLFVDTAGRLQNKVNLMNELAKMKRILTREIPDAPHEVLLVLDATTGQNALNQAKLFKESTDVTGIVLTKLDGTARGGIVLAIRNELHLPVKYVGLGEKVDDLQKFDAGDFVYGLFKGLVEVD